VEYGLYLVFVLAFVGICIAKIRELDPDSESRKTLAVDVAGSPSAALANGASEELELRQETVDVPTPWGWPGNLHEIHADHGLNGDEEAGHGALQRWVDHLVSEKQTVDSGEYRKRREASMRALLEDRFHSPNYAHIDTGTGKSGGVPNQPATGSDPINNDRPAAKLRAVPDTGLRKAINIRNFFDDSLSEVKMPWGW
jgi:hypothetical protein